MNRRKFAYVGVALAVLVLGRRLRSPAPPESAPSILREAADARNDERPRAEWLAQPPVALAEVGVLTDRSEAALEGVLDRDGLAARLRPELCGDESACEAVRRALKDEHMTTLRVEPASEWTLDRADFDASASMLSPSDRASLAKRSTVVLVRSAAPSSPRQLPLRTAFAAAAAVAAAIDGLVYDPVLGRIESAQTFATHAITAPLDASAFRLDRIQVLYEPKREGVARLLTAGLERFGAPDVEVARAPLVASERVTQLLAAVAGAIADGARVGPILVSAADGARSTGQPTAEAGWPTVAVDVVSVPPEAGDPGDFMVRIEPPAGDEPMGYLDLAESIFGPALGIPPDDAALQMQHERARRTLGPALGQWSASHKAGARLLVRLPFAIEGDAGVESMWVEVTGYDATTVTGVVVDEPLAATAAARGDRVKRPRTDVEDVRPM